jgi:hypothetical protein
VTVTVEGELRMTTRPARRVSAHEELNEWFYDTRVVEDGEEKSVPASGTVLRTDDGRRWELVYVDTPFGIQFRFLALKGDGMKRRRSWYDGSFLTSATGTVKEKEIV